MEKEIKQLRFRKNMRWAVGLIYTAPMVFLISPIPILSMALMVALSTAGIYIFVKALLSKGLSLKELLRRRYALIWCSGALILMIYATVFILLTMLICGYSNV